MTLFAIILLALPDLQATVLVLHVLAQQDLYSLELEALATFQIVCLAQVNLARHAITTLKLAKLYQEDQLLFVLLPVNAFVKTAPSHQVTTVVLHFFQIQHSISIIGEPLRHAMMGAIYVLVQIFAHQLEELLIPQTSSIAVVSLVLKPAGYHQ